MQTLAISSREVKSMSSVSLDDSQGADWIKLSIYMRSEAVSVWFHRRHDAV